ncbi:DUF2793 domain-containing protein [Sphingomonas aliaeris]|uniref:DUF2793 domain-containing protein n=1 Tax=Sphingomonas aliaeris TaxID=2759526 RepID=A0A974NV32_9SPHN|nr:DUF2793 domain-containing protein [Sphingomonas aliaeris]QQV77521.1 DUF2793 domain-containing protein [Sphingomonas aliaeris]
MNDDMTPRLGLPTIRPGQAQKESSHNEALTQLDLLMHANAVSLGLNTPPSAPVSGQAWVVGSMPAGDWSGHADALAGWTDGGWRFAAPIPGMTVWIEEAADFARYSDGSWILGELRGSKVVIAGNDVLGPRRAGIPIASGGSIIDVEARETLVEILAALRGHGLIAS